MSETEPTAREAEWKRVLSEAELAQMLDEARRVGLFLRKTPHRDGPGAPGCYLGGKPQLPPEFAWPEFDSPEGFSLPMQHFAQVNLAAMPRPEGLPPVPATGTMFFFLDLVLGDLNGWQPGSARVIYTDRNVTDLPEREMPPLPDLSALDPVAEMIWWHSQEPGGNHPSMPKGAYRKWPFAFEPFETVERYHLLNSQFVDVALEINEDVMSRLEETTRGDRQGEIGNGETTSDFSQNIMFGETRSEDRNLISLLALDGDPDTGIGPTGGQIKFVIDREDLEALNFEAAFVTERGI